MMISDISVRRPVFAAVISLVLVIIGVLAVDRLAVREFPDVDPPVISVNTDYRGASAEIVERRITQVLEDEIAGIVAFSGRILSPELLVDEAVSKPPVLLVHGDMDDVVPPQSLPQAAEALQGAGFDEVYAHIMKGTGHGIAPDGLSVALAFMRDKLGL